MLIAGGVYVEKCVAPDTTQLLGSGGRAALALSGMRGDITLHTFHPPALWRDLSANFEPFGIAVEPHPAFERLTFSYLFPLGRPVQTPAYVPFSDTALVEGREILTFGCVEGRFVAKGGAVVHDFQGAALQGFRASGSDAGRLALLLNRQEAMLRTGAVTLRDAAASLLSDEMAAVVVVKDGPRGAAVFNADGGEAWIPPYKSSRLYKIGSGDIFSATFAHRWLRGTEAAQAADWASRQTAAYVDAPVLPLAETVPPSTPRVMRVPERIYIAAHLPSLAHRWLAAVVEEALRHSGVEDVESVELLEWINGWRPKTTGSAAALICLTNAAQLAQNLRRTPATSIRDVIFLDEPVASHQTPGMIITDLSQALYELFWENS